jgi:hypothetical protein
MLTGVHTQSIDKTPPAPRLALPDGAPLQPPTHHPTSNLPPGEGVGSLREVAEGRGCGARVPVESPPHGSRRRPSPPFLTLPPSRITTAALRHLEERVGRKPKGLAEGGSRRGGKPPGGRRWRALPPFPTPPFSLIAAAA